MWGSVPSSSVGVGTGVNHTSLSPVNRMTGGVSMFC